MLIQNEQQQQQQPQAKQPKQQQQQKLTAIDAGCSRQRESRRRIMSISFYAVRQCPNYLPFSLSLSPAHSHALPFAATAAKAKKKKTFVRTDTQVLPGSFTLPLRACALCCSSLRAAPHPRSLCVAPNCVQPRSFCVAPHCARPHALPPFRSAHSALSADAAAAAGIPLTLPSYVCNCSCIYSYMVRAR